MVLASGKKPVDNAGLIPHFCIMSMEADLIRVTDAYCAAKGASRSRLSTILLNGGRALDSVAAGSTLTVRSWQDCMAWLSQNWPADVPWPQGIDRPGAEAFVGFSRTRRGQRRSAGSSEPVPAKPGENQHA